MSERLWTVIARCRECQRELNRAEHVPESEMSVVTISANLVALCPERSHNSGGDFNVPDLEWIEEVPNAD